MLYSKLFKAITALVFSTFILIGCGTQSDSRTGTFQVLLHDAPAHYDEVNVFIESVEVNNSAGV
ncbi:MAG: hypothetical protein U5K71_07780 [Gracilimonas sp.]|nr:hypothetical protein [Gracilimonas sp.]